LTASKKIKCYTHDYKKDGKYQLSPLYWVSQEPKDRVLPESMDGSFEESKDLIPNDCINQSRVAEEVSQVKSSCVNLVLYDEKDESHKLCTDFDANNDKDCFINKEKSLNFIKLQKCGNKKYIYKILTTAYDQNKCIIRDKNAYENGQCVALPKPTKCLSVFSRGIDDGFANWTEAEFGEYSEGKCIEGYEAKDASALKRLCTIYYNINFSAPNSGTLAILDRKKAVCTPIINKDENNKPINP
jgi:hypothetical protein